MSLFRLIVLIVSLFTLSACGKEATESSADAGAEQTASGELGEAGADVATGDVPAAEPLPAEDLGDFRVVAVLLGKTVDADQIVVKDDDTFSAKDAIYASVLSTGSNQGVRISAKWLAPDGQVIADTEQPLVPTSATATTFKISNPDGWPPGAYQLLIRINDRNLQTREFQVR
jgi:hypothetical protein